MSDTQSQDGPPILRPIPRRPFNLNLREPTPPEVDEDASPPSPSRGNTPALNLESLNARLLRKTSGDADSESLSRAQSVLNLTGSTLMGIYTPGTYGKDRFSFGDRDEPATPWGTGAETPAHGLAADEPHYTLHKERAHPQRRKSSHTATRPQPPSKPAFAMHLGLSAAVLSALGVLYGLLVARLHDQHRRVSSDGTSTVISSGGYDWRYLAFWAVAGVLLGGLLPWFDGIWEAAFGAAGDEVVADSPADDSLSVEGGKGKSPASAPATTDWVLAVRGIGTFVGIAFAIRKLPWDSTLQVSMTLALVNPVLWFLIDRSLPGLLMAGSVGIAGSALLLGLQPDMLPTPSLAMAFSAFDDLHNATSGPSYEGSSAGATALLGGIASQETVESGIWISSVLFCCCVCLGNIGRRLLALNLHGSSSAPARGRWSFQ